MADNVTLPGTGSPVATDDIGGAHFQKIKLFDATADSTTGAVVGARGLEVDPRLKVARIAVTPVVSTTPAYAAKDAVGGLMEFTNAARSAGGSLRIEAVQVVDKGQQMAALDLVLFDRTISAPTDNAVFAPSDAELANVVGVIPIGSYADLSTNSVADVPVARAVVVNGTSLFGVLVARGTPTYTSTNDLVVTLTVAQD